jgi:hypothetical protein
MRRALACGALIALLITSVAMAATKTYNGKIEGDQPSSVVLKVKRHHGERALKSFAANDFVISCRGSGDATLAGATLIAPPGGAIKVSDKGRFEATGSVGDQVLELAGRLSGKHSAAGTLHYSGPTPVDDATEDCDSGELHWSASR